MQADPRLLYVLIGLVSGLASGVFGVGGGVLIVPALMYVAGFSQLRATGTSLAVLLPPMGRRGARGARRRSVSASGIRRICNRHRHLADRRRLAGHRFTLIQSTVKPVIDLGDVLPGEDPVQNGHGPLHGGLAGARRQDIARAKHAKGIVRRDISPEQTAEASTPSAVHSRPICL
jgi:hypothetical protein